LWPQKPCANCHGDSAQGDFGPRLAGTDSSYDQVLQTVRAGRGNMPAFSEEQITDQELAAIYAWLTQ
jgi:mono/diheme cytochrome c family protein